jgi:two-component system NtrC family response regulator
MYYIAQFCDDYHLAPKEISPDFYDIISTYGWPGNVRELVHALHFAITTSKDERLLYSKHLPENIRIAVVQNSIKTASHPKSIGSSEQVSEFVPNSWSDFHDGLTFQAGPFPTYRDFRQFILSQAEQKYFQKLMVLTQGNIQASCQISDLGRTRLYTLLKKHNISRTGWSNQSGS